MGGIGINRGTTDTVGIMISKKSVEDKGVTLFDTDGRLVDSEAKIPTVVTD